MNTTQENTWRGEFGTRYTDRNMGRVPANRAFFRKVLRNVTPWPRTTLELGCGAGENLTALAQLSPGAHREGIEINPQAAERARVAGHMVTTTSILGYEPTRTYEMVFTKGVLIHIPPTELARAYEVLVKASERLVLVCEYYNQKPVEVPYQGMSSMLWKRDWAGDLLNTYKELRLVDYGFVYYRDLYPQDDVTWFLMEKTK